MVLRLTIVAAAAALLATGSDGAALSGAGVSRALWQGPVLAGDAVVWAEAAGGTGSIHLWRGRGDRVIYRSDSLALTRSLAASRTLLAFERSYPSCSPQPNYVCPQAEDALVGSLTGPFRTLVRPRTCTLATDGNAFAVDGGVAAYIELDCARDRLRVLVRDVAHRRGPIVLGEGTVSGGCCRAVAIAGRYVAWNDLPGQVVVYDRVGRRVAYRADIRSRAGSAVDIGFDLQQDAKLAVAYRSLAVEPGQPTTVAWFSRSAARPHVLRLRGRDTRIRIAGDRIAFERYVTPKTSALILADLAGRAQTVTRFVSPARLRGGFDFDGERLVWASDRITATRVDCPPPGQGRPCVRR